MRAPQAATLTPVVSAEALRSQLSTLAPGLEIIAHRALGNVDDAREVAQESLVRALKAIEEGRPIHGTLGAFVHGIAMHVIADVMRERHRVDWSDGTSLDGLHATAPSPLEAMIDVQERRAMMNALQQLDESERLVLRRCYVDGEKVAAIARDMGEPAARIRKRKSRALHRLRELLIGDAERSHSPAAADDQV